MSETLPTPGDALQTSIDLYNDGRLDEARYWLDVARELRAGQRPRQATPMNEPLPAAEVDSTMRIIPGYNESDATAIIRSVEPKRVMCPSCGGETFLGENGAEIHRSTYKVECEFATVGR